MKRILAFFLCILTLLSFVGCDETYDPVESTDEEATTVFKITVGDTSYRVKYELYRAFFLNMRETVDGGDKTVWSGEDKEEYIAKIDALVFATIADIYSVLYEAKKIGIDPYSDDFDEKVEQYVKVGVEGGMYNDTVIEGFGGDYGKYLAALKAANSNYSVQDLMIRYSLAYGELTKYYAGYVKDETTGDRVEGKIEYTEQTVEAFYFGNESARVLCAYLPASTTKNLQELRQNIINAANYGDSMVRQIIGGQSQSLVYDVDNGELIGKYSRDSVYYGELIEAAFNLKRFEVSEVISITSDTDAGYYILYKLDKDRSNFEKCYNDIVEIYKQNEIGKMLNNTANQLVSSIEYTDFFKLLDRASISMN